MRLMKGREQGPRSSFIRKRFIRVGLFQAEIEGDLRQDVGDFTFGHHLVDPVIDRLVRRNLAALIASLFDRVQWPLNARRYWFISEAPWGHQRYAPED